MVLSLFLLLLPPFIASGDIVNGAVTVLAVVVVFNVIVAVLPVVVLNVNGVVAVVLLNINGVVTFLTFVHGVVAIYLAVVFDGGGFLLLSPLNFIIPSYNVSILLFYCNLCSFIL